MRRALLAVCMALATFGCGPSSDKVFKARMASAHEVRADVDRAVALYDEAARGAARREDAMAAREAAATLLERSARGSEAEPRWAAIANDAGASAADKGTAELRLIALRSPNERERFDAERAWLVAHPSHAAAPKIVREQFLGLESDEARTRFADELLAVPAAERIAPWLRLEKARIAARAGRLAEAVAGMEASRRRTLTRVVCSSTTRSTKAPCSRCAWETRHGPGGSSISPSRSASRRGSWAARTGPASRRSSCAARVCKRVWTMRGVRTAR